jgi:hypothetical protein
VSYDLFFRAKSSEPTLGEIRAHFASRPNYEVGDSQVMYENTITGVYFSFDLDRTDEERSSVAFNINYFRPHVFALEAEPELTAFMQRFELDIEDPQMDGMAEGPYTPEGFLRGWNAGNRFAHRALSRDMRPADLRTLPARALFETWSWNHQKPYYEDLLCSVEMIVGYVPTILLLEKEREPGRILSAVVWADAMPIAMPRVDAVLIAGELAPRGPSLVPFDRIEPLLRSYARREGHRFNLDGVERHVPLVHYMVDHEEPPPGLVADLKSLVPREPEQVSRIALDQVLDRELAFA